MGLDYARQKLWEAAYALGANALPIQARVRAAVLCLVMVRTDDFENDDRGRGIFGSVMERANALPAVADEGTIDATTSRMNDEQAVAVARDIIELLGHVSR